MRAHIGAIPANVCTVPGVTKPTDDDARMRQVLVEMGVISEASSTRLGDVVHGGEPDRSPKGPRVSMAAFHARAYRRARGPLAKAEALDVAEKALTNARYAPKRTNIAGTLEWRLAIGDDPRPAKVVAEVYGVAIEHVYYCRKRNKSAR